MILGIGTDLLDMRRIQGIYARFPQAFPKRLLSSEESDRTHDARSLAKLFCAKEACSKALGTGIGQKLGFQDITVQHQLKAPPKIHVAPYVIAKIWPHVSPKNVQLDLSLSDEYPYVQAFVIALQIS